MNGKTLPRIVATWAILLLGSLSLLAQTSGSQLYGITFFNNQLISIDPVSGQGTLVGSLNGVVSGYGIAARYGRLYTFDPNTDEMVAIDPATASLGTAVNIGVTNVVGEGDLAFRSDGVGFLTSALHPDGSVANDLYTFDVIAGTSQRIGSTPEPLNGLAFDNNDVLYALGKDDTNLYTVNQSNGALTVVGPLGIAASSPFAGMTFGPDGTLYAAINDQLYVINKSTGAATPSVDTNVLDIGFSSVSGLAFQTPRPTLQLVGITAGDQLFSINLTNGTGSLIGDLATNISGFGLGVASNTLFTFDTGNGELVGIDPATGDVSSVVDLSLTNLSGEGGLAFAPGGTGFIASLNTSSNGANALYSFNLLGGTTAFVTNTTPALNALAIDTNGVLYALGASDANLYTINQTNGAATTVGALGLSGSTADTGLAFGPDGTLYAAINNRLYTISKISGTATAVGSGTNSLGFTDVSGLAFVESPAQLTLAKEGTNLVIFGFETGYVLESSTNVAGPYTPAGIQNDPSRVTNTGTQMYFVLRHD